MKYDDFYPENSDFSPENADFYCKNHLKTQKKRRKKRKILCILLGILLIFTGLAIYFHRNVSKMVLAVGEATLRAAAVSAINEAVFFTLQNERAAYDDLVDLRRDEQGNIASLAANPLKINKIARETAAFAQEKIDEASRRGVPVPIGSLTGIEALAGYGKKIRISIISASNVLCAFSSTFRGAGVNQTKHSVYINAIADISIISTSKTKKISVTSEILVAECILIGAIPDVYFQNDLFGKIPSLSGDFSDFLS